MFRLFTSLLLGGSFLFADQAEVKGGGLTEMSVELSAIVDYFVKRKKALVLPNDGNYDALKARKAKILLPQNLIDIKRNPELWDSVYEKTLASYGYALVPDSSGDFYRLVPAKDTSKIATPVLAGEGIKLDSNRHRVVTRIIRFKHTDSSRIRPLFRYISQISAPLDLQDKNTIVVTARESDLSFFEKMVSAIDVPSPKPHHEIYLLKWADPSWVKVRIVQYFEDSAPHNPKIVGKHPILVADDRTGRLFVTAHQEDHSTVRELVEFLDVEVSEEHKKTPSRKKAGLKE